MIYFPDRDDYLRDLISIRSRTVLDQIIRGQIEKEERMGLIIDSEPEEKPILHADQLEVGAWFIDEYHEVYLVVQDDTSCDKRIVCIGDLHPPFLINKECYSDLRVARVLENNTTLRITNKKQQETLL